jgi:hypothetical protein
MTPKPTTDRAPEHNGFATITDGRRPGEYMSRYPGSAWAQICVECAYLLLALSAASLVLLRLSYDLGRAIDDPRAPVLIYFSLPAHRPTLIWIVIALSGACGGTLFTLKWLYHSVAKEMWNRDRVLWRFLVPILSGVLAVFLAFMIASGIVPFFNQKAFSSFYSAAGFGFFVGLFSDNAIAALQRLAIRTFGNVSGSRSTDAD